MARRRPAAPPPERPALDWVAALLVAQLAFVAFLPALRGEFVLWDDDTNFLKNTAWRGLGWDELEWMLTTPHKGQWIPLSWLTLGLDYRLWGLHPSGFHLTSLILHAANAALVYAVARRVLARALPAGGEALRVGAGLAALLFALHPLRVESVAWITERRDVVSGLFYLLALLAYLFERRRLALGAFALGLLAKAIVVSLPVVLLLLDVWPLRRLGWADLRRAPWRVPALREKLPFVLLAAAGSASAVWAMVVGSGLTAPAQLGLVSRVAISFYSTAFYLWKTLWPLGLSPLYELPVPFDPWGWPTLLAAAVTLALSALALATARRAPAFAAAWAAYLVILLPVVGIVHNGPQIAADRYTYLACLPWALLAGGGAVVLARRLAARPGGRALAGALAGLAAGVVLALGALTGRQARIWHDSEALWQHALRVSPSAIAHNNLAVLRSDENRWDAVLAHAEAALRLRPAFAEAHAAAGAALDRLQRTDEAIAHFQEAIRVDPRLPAAWNHWGVALGRQGRLDEALARFRHALELNPEYADAYHNIGVALERQGKTEEARAAYGRARAIRAAQAR